MEPDEDNSSVYLILLFLAKPSKILDLYSATFNSVRILTMTASFFNKYILVFLVYPVMFDNNNCKQG